MKIRSIAISILLLLIAQTPSMPARAQEGVSISGQQVSYLFGKHVAFQAQLETPNEVSAVDIVFREEAGPETIVLPADLGEDGQVVGVYELDRGMNLQAFITIVYWFRVHLGDQTMWESTSYSFQYRDNRYEWNHIQEGPLHVYTHQGDAQFAQSVMDAARKGLEGVYQLLDAPVAEEMRFYVYSEASDLQSALNLGSVSWLAGHADPANRLALVSIPNGQEQQTEIERQIPHEVTHLLLYQMTGSGYSSLPAWLNEGLASNLELTNSPELRRSFDRAREDGTLLPIGDLCGAFPADASQATLAYAEAESFVRFLISRYGRIGLNALVERYAAGEGCERGVVSALGANLELLEREWRAVQFNESPFRLLLSEIGLWLALLLLGVMGPLGFAFMQRRKERRS